MKHRFGKKPLLFYLAATLLFPACASLTHNRTTTAASQATATQTHTQTDTATHRRHTLLRSLPVPASQARLTLPLDPIRQLPPEASYTQKTGQATATLRFHHDTLYIYATCDSLQTLLYAYEEEISRLHQTTTGLQTLTESKNEKMKTTAGWFRPTPLLLPLLILLIAGWPILARKKKRNLPKT